MRLVLIAFLVTTLAACTTAPKQASKSPEPAVVAVSGRPALALGSYNLESLGYQTDEFFVSGVASSYTLVGEPTADGRWQAKPADTASYTTRIVVVRPSDPRKFNGTVVVEWLNVTGGVDAAGDWNALHRELIRSGFAYAAVSVQKVGIEGGKGVMGAEGAFLKKADPQRYGTLNHPGDAFSFDMFSQAGSLFQGTAAGKLLGNLVPKRVIAVGESQSAMFLTTYMNAIDPIAKTYDGFLIHSRFGIVPFVDGAFPTTRSAGPPKIVQFRPDLRVPVIAVITETDLVDRPIPGYHAARRPDDKRLRVWEIAGTAHADNYTFAVGPIDSGSAPLQTLAAAYAPTVALRTSKLDKPMNFGPQHHYVVEAALAQLDRWIRVNQAPPNAVPMELSGGSPAELVPDANGLAKGGVRTPWVDVPTAHLSGIGNSGTPVAFLLGVGEPFDAPTLDRLYPGGKQDYMRRFEASLASAIRAGFILPADRREITDLAEIAYGGSH